MPPLRRLELEPNSSAIVSNRKAVHLSILGHVQGVGFRASLCERAAWEGVQGWVRNRRGGWVEALVTGEATAVDAVLAWAQRGPAGADVQRGVSRPPTAAELALREPGTFALLATD